MKVLFLDIDGVLNGYPFIHDVDNVPSWEPGTDRDEWWRRMLNPECITRLNRIVEATGCVCVLSSTWRKLNHHRLVEKWLKQVGGFTGEIVDRTPSSNTGIRGEEIQAWMDEHGAPEVFVILDDDSDMLHLRDRLVLTSLQRNGLQDDEADQAIEMLGGRQ